MAENDGGPIPVVDKLSKSVLGIATDRGIVCRAVAAGKDPRSILVVEGVSKAAATARDKNLFSTNHRRTHTTMQTTRYLLATALMAFIAITGCQPQTPAQKVEDKMEDAAHETKQGVERAGEKIQNATDGR